MRTWTASPRWLSVSLRMTTIPRSGRELTVRALMTENREHIYHAAMIDPHTASELDLELIWRLIDELIAAHGDWLPAWAR